MVVEVAVERGVWLAFMRVVIVANVAGFFGAVLLVFCLLCMGMPAWVAAGFFAVLYVFIRSLFALIAWSDPVLVMQSLAIASMLVVSYSLYAGWAPRPARRAWEILVTLSLPAWSIYRLLYWKGIPPAVIEYTVAALLYYYAWRGSRDYGLRVLFALPVIADMRELVYVWSEHPAYWLLNPKPLLWLWIAMAHPGILEKRPRRILAGILLIVLANLLDYATAHGILDIAGLVGPTVSATIVRLVAVPAPLYLVARGETSGLYKRRAGNQ